MSLESEIKKQKAKNSELQKKGQPQRVYNLIKEKPVFNEPPKGERFSTCKLCGKQFEQNLSEERNVYSSFKTCPACRKRISQEKTEEFRKDTEHEVAVASLPYTPYAWQLEAHEAFENHRFIVLACGNRCLTAGSFINGCDKVIEEVKVGDKVINKNGELQKVTAIEPEQYEGNVYTVKAIGCEPYQCSETHPICVMKIGKNGEFEESYEAVEDIKNRLEDGENLYLKMARLKGSIKCDYWKFDRFEKNYQKQLDGIPINEDTAWMIGLYVAEGCFLGQAGCKFTLNYKEPELANKLCKILDDLGLHYNVRERENEGTRCVIVTKMQFCNRMDKECGHGSLNKKIPESILYNKDDNILIAFLKGYYDGDGCLGGSNKTLRATTVSRTLAQQIQTAWNRLGFFCKINSTQRDRKRLKKDGTFGIVSKEYITHINEAEAMKCIGYDCDKKKYRNTAIVTDNAIYTKLKFVDVNTEKTTIYAMSTFDESFSCFNTLVGNSGKDRFTIMAGIRFFVECLNENRAIDHPDMVPTVLWWQIAPTEKLAKQNWRELKQYFPKQWVVACSDSDFVMQTIGGGIIEVRSGYDPNTLVGSGVDLVTVTEAARFTDLKLAWANLEARLNSPGRGREKDRAGHRYGAGKAIINSSPLGKNDFYRLFCYGQKSHSDYSSIWWSKQFPWTCNPANAELAESIVHGKYGDIKYEESLRRQIGDRTFRSNYLADFLAEDGTVFKKFEENCIVNLYSDEFKDFTEADRKKYIEEWKAVDPYGNYVGGYDPATGSSGDSPFFVIRNLDTNHIVRVFDLYGKSYEQQYDFIANICKQYNYAPIHWLRTGHTAIEGQFQSRGIQEVPIDEQGEKKKKLVQTLELAVENGDLKVLVDGSDEVQKLIYEMNDYTEKNGKYANSAQPHDDSVSALYAVYSDYTVADAPVYYCGMMGGI